MRLWILAGTLAGLALATTAPAHAQCYVSPGICSTNTATDVWWKPPGDPPPPNSKSPPFSDKMTKYLIEDFYYGMVVSDLWTNYFLPTLQGVTAQLVSNDAYTSGITGTMMDGLVMNRTVLALQTLESQAYKDYTPGETLCRFGTNTRSLAAASQKSQTTLMALASIGQARQLGTKGGSADAGMIMDRTARIDQFTRIYCDPGDNDGALGPICGGTTPKTRPERFNRDISISRTLLGRSTLDLDLADGTLTDDEEDLLALSSNLYGHDVMRRLTEIAVSSAAGNATAKVNYLDLRQLAGLRNVAQGSFNAAAARRAKGSAAAQPFMTAALQELGMSVDEASRYWDSGTKSPSYHAQMGILTKTLSQNPNFFTHLVDKPANVDRTRAALQAIGLMQDRDIQDSLKQQEVLLSMVLEMKLRREQREVQRALGVRGGTQ